MFVGRPGAYYRVDHLRDASIGKALALITMIRLDWNFLAGTNTLAYYKYLKKMSIKVLQNLAQVEVNSLLH